MSGWTPLLAAHAGAAGTSLLLGGYQLLRPVKGDVRHRIVGWTWVIAMTFVAGSSFAIRDLRSGRFSLLHILSVITLASLVLAIWYIRRGNVAGHRQAMAGSYFGLVAAFIGAAAVPSRVIPTFAVDDPLGLVLAVLATVGVALVVVIVAWLVSRRLPTRKVVIRN
jgi:uncharacterized membrane protein